MVGPAIRFKHGQLLIGWRRRDWKAVWFGLNDPSQGDDDGASNGSTQKPAKPGFVFSTADRKTVWAAPIKGEISWESHFDPAECEATNYNDKMKMQREFLTKAHNYMSEQDSERVRQMEQDLDDPDFGRWQSWFEAAKKEKHRRLRTRRRRTSRFQADGISNEDIREQVSSDISDHEDDIESDHDSTYEGFGPVRNSMPPPPRPWMGERKRKADERGRKDNGRKKRKARYNTPDEDNKQFQIRGGRGSSHGSVGGFTRSPMMDIRPPPRMTATPMNTPPPSNQPANVRHRSNLHRAAVESVGDEDDDNMFVDQNLGEPNDNGWRNADDYNGGGIDEDEATRQAISESVGPEDRRDQPVPSIERDEDEKI